MQRMGAPRDLVIDEDSAPSAAAVSDSFEPDKNFDHRRHVLLVARLVDHGSLRFGENVRDHIFGRWKADDGDDASVIRRLVE